MGPARARLLRLLPAFARRTQVGDVVPGRAPTPAEAGRWRCPVQYFGIYEDDAVSIGVFFLNKGAVIPLHNHPAMTVYSKILFGDLSVASYDWVDGAAQGVGVGVGVGVGGQPAGTVGVEREAVCVSRSRYTEASGIYTVRRAPMHPARCPAAVARHGT